MIAGLSRTLTILCAIILGALLPQAQALAGLIRWLVMTMLFLVFLQTRMSRAALHRSHFTLLGVNITIGFAAWALGWAIGGREIALAAFFCGITPTAIAAPVITSFLRGRVDYVVAAFVLTNTSIAALLPFFLPVVLGRSTPEAFGEVVGSVGLVVFLPLVAARAVRALHPPAAAWPDRLRNVSFGMWVAGIFLISAKSSAFIRSQDDSPLLPIAQVAASSLIVCAASFAIGRWVGGRQFAREASQALGQKNTAFTIYLALAYASPLVALGPTTYVLWHNLWNSWNLRHAGRERAPRPQTNRAGIQP